MSVFLISSEGWPGIQAAEKAIGAHGASLDIIEAAIREVEAETSIVSVGTGGWPNMIGKMELDASIMNGRTLAAGAVGALKGFIHPISVARQVMEGLPHILLVGEGASRFAEECGAEKGENLTDSASKGYQNWVKNNVTENDKPDWPEVSLLPYSEKPTDPEKTGGTVCAMCIDDNGHMTVGVSTSGWAWKYPGRLGDTPLIGSGGYADEKYGAAACIGSGEMAIRAGTARAVVLYLKMGLSLPDACKEAAADLMALKGGWLGGVTILAIDKNGNHFVLAVGTGGDREYFVQGDGMEKCEKREAELFPI